jgi:hypothetical protein
MVDKASPTPQYPCNYCGGLQVEQEDGTVVTDNSAHTKTCILYSEPKLTLTEVQALMEDIATRVQANHDENHYDIAIVSFPDGGVRDVKSWKCPRCLEAIAIIRLTLVEK